MTIRSQLPRIGALTLLTLGIALASGDVLAQGRGGGGAGAPAGAGVQQAAPGGITDRDRDRDQLKDQDKLGDRDQDRTRDRLNTQMMDRDHDMQTLASKIGQTQNVQERLRLMDQQMGLMRKQVQQMTQLMGKGGTGAGEMERNHIREMSQHMTQMAEQMRTMNQQMEQMHQGR